MTNRISTVTDFPTLLFVGVWTTVYYKASIQFKSFPSFTTATSSPDSKPNTFWKSASLTSSTSLQSNTPKGITTSSISILISITITKKTPKSFSDYQTGSSVAPYNREERCSFTVQHYSWGQWWRWVTWSGCKKYLSSREWAGFLKMIWSYHRIS